MALIEKPLSCTVVRCRIDGRDVWKRAHDLRREGPALAPKASWSVRRHRSNVRSATLSSSSSWPLPGRSVTSKRYAGVRGCVCYEWWTGRGKSQYGAVEPVGTCGTLGSPLHLLFLLLVSLRHLLSASVDEEKQKKRLLKKVSNIKTWKAASQGPQPQVYIKENEIQPSWSSLSSN